MIWLLVCVVVYVYTSFVIYIPSEIPNWFTGLFWSVGYKIFFKSQSSQKFILGFKYGGLFRGNFLFGSWDIMDGGGGCVIIGGGGGGLVGCFS